jgi:tetratricopeptide (TPR) repeat protein
MWREWKNTALRWVYGLVILFQLFILYHTATRGAILGLLGGVLIVALVSMFNKSEGGKVARKAGVVILLALVVLVGGFFALRDAEFMRNSPVLSRFSSLTTEELKTQGRYFVWPIAWQGFKERPLLGWGQENFNYVFNKHYLPEMYHLEPWFDRAHNIFLDWAVAGGLLGLISYLALYVALLFSIWKRGTAWSHAEKSILTGLVAAYFFHNFFVFDHLVSYILFFSLLAYVHHVSGSEISPKKTLTQVQVRNIALPVVSILLLLSLYFVNIKPIIGNVYLIEAIKSLQTPGEIKAATQHLQSAYGASRLGRPETVEQLAVRSVSILSSEEISIEEKNDFFSFTNSAMLKETQNFPDDARTQLLAGSLFSSVSSADESLVYLERARLLMPNKQQIYFEIGAAYINKNEPLRALEIFKEAFELAPQYIQAQKVYLVGAIYAGDRVVESEMIDKLTEREVVFDDQIINAYYTNKRLDRIVSLLEDRIRLDPDNADGYRELIEQVRQ